MLASTREQLSSWRLADQASNNNHHNHNDSVPHVK